MSLGPYSSFAAFAAHYLALRGPRALTGTDRATLAEMNELLEALGPEVRTALDAPAAGPAEARRRERAERRLARELAARGIVAR